MRLVKVAPASWLQRPQCNNAERGTYVWHLCGAWPGRSRTTLRLVGGLPRENGSDYLDVLDLVRSDLDNRPKNLVDILTELR